MNTHEIRLLPYYLIPKDWIIHLIDRRTTEQQLEHIQRIIENAQLLAFDTETMPSFYQRQTNNWTSARCQSQSNLCMNKPSLLQVAVRSSGGNGKNVLLFDLQELFDQSHIHFRPCSISLLIPSLLRFLFSHSQAYKLSQSLFNDLAQLKCSYDEDCFHTSKLEHIIELSQIYRRMYPNEKVQELYSLQRMTAMTLHYQLDKKQQCANWSKRPLNQLLKDYAAIDVIVMIDIYDRLRKKFEDELVDSSSSWTIFRQSMEISIDLSEIVLYACICHQRFMTTKTRQKHARTCPQYLAEQNRVESISTSDNPSCHQKKPKTSMMFHNHSIDSKMIVSSVWEHDLDCPTPCGRGYLPPALKRAFQSMNQYSFCEQVRSSSAFDRWNQFNKNRPPDAQFFLEDDDTEVAQAFGLQSIELSSSLSMPMIANSNHRISLPSMARMKSNMKVAAYPPKTTSESSKLLGILENIQTNSSNEKILLDRLKDDFDSQPEFHCHLFGLGGRGRSLSIHLSPPSPTLTR